MMGKFHQSTMWDHVAAAQRMASDNQSELHSTIRNTNTATARVYEELAKRASSDEMLKQLSRDYRQAKQIDSDDLRALLKSSEESLRWQIAGAVMCTLAVSVSVYALTSHQSKQKFLS